MATENTSTGGIWHIIAGAAAIAAGIAVDLIAGPAAGLAVKAIASSLIAAGAGQVISGAGTLIAGFHADGFATAIRNPISPWLYCYGECRPKMTMVYCNTWGTNNQMLDLVFVIAAHSIYSFDNLYFDQRVVPINNSYILTGGLGGSSFSPATEDFGLASGDAGYPGSVIRANGVVQVTTAKDIPYLDDGWTIEVYGMPNQYASLNGTFQVSQLISHTPNLVFTYLQGGLDLLAANVGNLSNLAEQEQNWSNDVYMEVLQGQQALGSTFLGMAFGGTPWQPSGPGPYQLIDPDSPGLAGNSPGQSQGTPNPWTNYCSLTGMSTLFLRLTYDNSVFPSGVPQISCAIHGKNNIYDPRLGAYGANATTGYTDNAALCIADFLHGGAVYSAPWDSATTYAAGAIASYLNVDYISAISGNAGNEPDTSTSDWTPVSASTMPGVWNPATAYTVGALVVYTPASPTGITYTREYICIQNSTNNEPYTSASYWAVITPFPGNVYTFASPHGASQAMSPPVPFGYSAPYVDPTGSTVAPWNSINIPALITAANVCDQQVETIIGAEDSAGNPAPIYGYENRYACDGQFDLSMRRGEILENMLTSCAGRLTYVDGQYYIQPGYWTGPGSPPLSMDLIQLASGPFTWKPICKIRDLYNGVKGTYISPEHHWEATDFPPYAQDALHGYLGPPQYGGDINLAADGGQRRWLDVQLPFTISYSAAQRIVKIELLRRRNYGTGTFALTMAGYQLIPLDIIYAQNSFLGWSNYTVEVQAVRVRIEKQTSGSSKEESLVLYTEVDLKDINEDIYDWSVTEELSPEGYQQSVLPAGNVFESVPFPWSPGYVFPLSGDAVYLPGNGATANFGIVPVIATDANGNPEVVVQILGTPPINVLDKTISGPYVTATASSTGGSLIGGLYSIGIAAADSGSANYKTVYYLDIYTVSVPSGSTGSISIAIEWGSGDNGGDLYVSYQPQLVSGASPWQVVNLTNAGQQLAKDIFHRQVTIASSTTSYTLTSYNANKHGGPDTLAYQMEVAIQEVVHTGPWAAQIQAITATTITVAGPGTTLNQWAGYTLTLLGKFNQFAAPLIILNMAIASNTASSGTIPEFTITIGANSAGDSLPDLTTLLTIGDLVGVRYNATFGANTLTDANIVNGYYPGGIADNENGLLAVVLTGADAGDVQVVSSTTSTEYTLASNWQTTPATGDVVVIVSPKSFPPVDSPPIMSPNPGLPGAGVVVTATPPSAGTWLYTARVKAQNGVYPPDFMNPKRDAYVFGGGGAPYRFNAGFQTPIANDSLYPDYVVGLFAVNQTYPISQNGVVIPTLSVIGFIPYNEFSATVPAPTMVSATTATTGGSILGGHTYIFGAICYDAAGPAVNYTPVSNLVSVAVPAGTNTNTISITVNWPVGSYGGLSMYAVDTTEYGLTQGFALAGGSPTSGNATYTFTGAIQVPNFGGQGTPDDNFDHMVYKISREFVSGIAAQTANAVTHVDSTHGIFALGGSGLTVNGYVGRTISLLAGKIGDTNNVIIADFEITANDAAGNFTVTPDPTAGAAIVHPGSLVTIRTAPTSATANSFTDTGFVNPYNSGGLIVNGNTGNLVFVLAGTGAGQPPVVVQSNTNDTIYVSPNWTIAPDSTSVIVLVDQHQQVTNGNPLYGSALLNPGFELDGQIQVSNYNGQVIRVEAYTSNSVGLTGLQQYVAAREIYLWGSGVPTTYITHSDSPYSTSENDVDISADTSGGDVTVNLLPLVNAPVRPMNVTKSTSDSNTVTVQVAGGGTISSPSGPVSSVTLTANSPVFSGSPNVQ